jgi:tRNA threonylcarbamoyl adenosine modification protein YjeE
MASLVGQGDLVTLTGDLGAGKTTFARALIRHICGDPGLETPSPSFTLMQIYESQKFPIVHADLYRVESAHELVELGWDEAAEGALVLVEWADRIGEGVDPDRLDIAFALDPARADWRLRALLANCWTKLAGRTRRAASCLGMLPCAPMSGWKRLTDRARS